MFHVKHNVRNVSCETLFTYAKLIKNYIQYIVHDYYLIK